MVPDLVFDDGTRVADLLHEARPLLLDMSGGAACPPADAWAGHIDVVTATMSDRPAAAMLVRPDGYVAWAADELGADDADRLRGALTRWFGAA
jgi:hypothetical protein